jgi:hypothetical protein
MSKLINGLPIKNATESLLLHITGPDVKSARPKRPDLCVVAQAVKRELRAKEVRVHLGRVYVRTTASSWTRYITPGSLRTEIISFDRGGTFSLGVHTLQKIGPVKLKKAGKTQGTRKPLAAPRFTGTGHKRRAYHAVRDVRTSPAFG